MTTDDNTRIEELAPGGLRTAHQSISRLDEYAHARFGRRFRRIARRLAAHIPRGGVIADVGANHGRFAKEFARLHGGSCSVLAFEPLEYNLGLLRAIVGKLRNVRVFDVALSDREGEAELYVPYKPGKHVLAGSAHLGNEAHAERFGTSTAPSVRRAHVRTQTLDAALASAEVERLDFMKIDVEGAEALVLEGARGTLERDKPAIYCELQAGLSKRLGLDSTAAVELLTGMGYEMRALNEKTLEERPCAGLIPGERDYLFTPTNSPLRAAPK